MKAKSPDKDITLIQLFDRFSTDDKARKHLETVLWKNGQICPHCNNHKDKPIYALEAKSDSESAVRAGVYKCGACLKQFTVTVGTIFESSHIPLRKWLIAWYLLCSSKKGISSLQLQRILEIGSYRTALFMTHRIRHALKEINPPKLSGIIEADDHSIGGQYPNSKGGKMTNKQRVVFLVQRGGNVRSCPVNIVHGGNIKQVIRDNVEICSEVHTDTYLPYKGLEPKYTHKTVLHAKGEYTRREGDKMIGTPHVESHISLLKRGLVGTFHHVSMKHSPLYLAEFDFRYNWRKASDGIRTDAGLTKAIGKRLMLHPAKP